MRPDANTAADSVRISLERGRVRLLARDLMHGLAVGSLVAAAGMVFAVAVPTLVAAALILAAVIVTVRARFRTTKQVASLIERADSSHGNLIVTAEELLRHPDRAADWVRQRVFESAAFRLHSVDLRAAAPIGRAATGAAAALLLVALSPLAARIIGPTTPGSVAVPSGSTARGGTVIEARLAPPSYSGRPRAVLTNPARIDALEGTRLTLVATNPSGSARVRFGDRVLPVSQSPNGSTVEMVLVASGYLAIELGDREPVRLVAVTVTPDRAPNVRVERPGRDLLLPDARGGVSLEGVASDDIGLDGLALKYTRVSGAGEQFEFVEGELPLDLVKDSTQTWRARGRIPIGTLGLEPGDSLVYRLTARDARPGTAGSATSDTFFVEIAGPGQVALEGFAMPPEQERYALSQQMIVLKLRRLREREKGLTLSALDEQTSAIAAEQRAVRGNFVFLMGGHVEDEEEEAEQSHEIQEGRLENTATREIWRAVSHMTSTEQALVAHDTSAALAAAMKAVEALQNAFTKSRYILRTLPSRLRIDPSRRLSGELDEVKDGQRPATNPADSGDAVLSRLLLAETMALIPRLRSEKGSAQVVAALSTAAERAFGAGAGDPDWSRIAQSFLRLRDAVSGGAPQARIDTESRAIVQALLQRARKYAARVDSYGVDRLESAWAEEARRR